MKGESRHGVRYFTSKLKETGLWLGNVDHEETLESIILHIPNSEENAQDAQIFLHGVCGVFALALHNRFGYKLGWILDDEDRDIGEEIPESYDPWDHLIHIFCVIPSINSHDLLVDVRGITPNIKPFCEPFEDFFTPPGYFLPEPDLQLLEEELKRTMGNDDFSFYYACAQLMIDQHLDWYM